MALQRRDNDVSDVRFEEANESACTSDMTAQSCLTLHASVGVVPPPEIPLLGVPTIDCTGRVHINLQLFY